MQDKLHIKRDTSFGTLKKLKRAASRRKPGLSRKLSKRGVSVDAVDSANAGMPEVDESPETKEGGYQDTMEGMVYPIHLTHCSDVTHKRSQRT